MNENFAQYLESNKRLLKACQCHLSKGLSHQKPMKLTNICKPKSHHKRNNDFFEGYKLQPPVTNKTQYLYVDQSFISNVTCPADEDVFYDCCVSESEAPDSSTFMADIKEPRNLKFLLKDVAMTTHVLYKTFRKAYHTTKKGSTPPTEKAQSHERKGHRRTRKESPEHKPTENTYHSVSTYFIR